MKKKQLLTIVFILSINYIFSQENIFVGKQSDNTDKTVYTAMQNIWYANEKISYVCFPIINNQISPAIPLRPGEGLNGSYIVEGNLFEQLPIAMGRNQGNKFWQTSRLNFDFGLNLRMSQEESNPLLPNNNIVGLSVNKIIWNSYTSKKLLEGDPLYYSFENWSEKEIALQNLSLDLAIHHYSNGQQAGFFLYDTIQGVPVRRNDYKKGDFSTNYIKLGFTYSYLTIKRNLFSANLAYQYDGSLIGPLVYSTEQEKSYGHNRISSFLQFRKLIRFSPFNNYTAYDYAADKRVKMDVTRYGELVFRWEGEYIADNDLSQYISTPNKHRFNQHFYVQYTQPNWRTLGLLFHTYYGRDYSNIRYDMPIFAMMFGVSINFNKYKPALSVKDRYKLTKL